VAEIVPLSLLGLNARAKISAMRGFMKVHAKSIAVFVLCASLISVAQQTMSTDVSVTVPPLVNYSGVLKDVNGKPLHSMSGVTFYLYKESEGGSPVWMETQNVQPDANGHYSVLLGSTTSTGLPSNIFTTGEAHWLGVQVQGQDEQARVLLVSAPYALKAGDAETIGGLPASAFLRAPSSGSTSGAGATTQTNAPPPGTITGVLAGTDLTGGGTSGTVTLNLDTTKVPQLTSNNTFTGKQTINNSTTITGTDPTGVLHVTNTVTSGFGPAIVAKANSSGASAVKGIQNATSGTTAGIYGSTNSLTGQGVYGIGGIGVEGVASLAGSSYGGLFYGYSAPSGSGGNGTTGLVATGGEGDSPNYGSGANGLVAYGGYGAYAGTGVLAYGSDGDYGSGAGVIAFGGTTAYNVGAPGGEFTSGTDRYGIAYDAIDASTGYTTGSYAGNFTGDLNVTGNVYAAAKYFKIDHPQDPANKYLFHASVESSELMNIYSGNVTTDGSAEAHVQLPDWFEAANGDFRYQLTVIGQFAQAIVSEKVANHQFSIRTSVPNVEVSWQITAVRQDAFAKAHPIVVEQSKSDKEKGYYIHPELYGAPAEKQLEWARNPEWMKKVKAARSRQHSQHPAQQPEN
jgi:hypothetical protein